TVIFHVPIGQNIQWLSSMYGSDGRHQQYLTYKKLQTLFPQERVLAYSFLRIQEFHRHSRMFEYTAYFPSLFAGNNNDNAPCSPSQMELHIQQKAWTYRISTFFLRLQPVLIWQFYIFENDFPQVNCGFDYVKLFVEFQFPFL